MVSMNERVRLAFSDQLGEWPSVALCLCSNKEPQSSFLRVLSQDFGIADHVLN